MTKEERHILIERYFGADTSADEERRLRTELLRLPTLDKEETETLAIMGYVYAKPVAWTQSKSKFGRRILQCAAVAGAVIVTAVALSTAWHMDSPQDQSRCIAYVGGAEITDEAHIMNLVYSQLSEMSVMSGQMDTEITGDFNEIRNALKMEGI